MNTAFRTGLLGTAALFAMMAAAMANEPELRMGEVIGDSKTIPAVEAKANLGGTIGTIVGGASGAVLGSGAVTAIGLPLFSPAGGYVGAYVGSRFGNFLGTEGWDEYVKADDVFHSVTGEHLIQAGPKY